MKIKKTHIEQFMLFDTLDIDWSANINVISGNNNTGKTALLKLLYASVKALHDVNNAKAGPTAGKITETLASKLNGVFKPDADTVGRLVKRKRGSNRAEIEIQLEGSKSIKYGFGNKRVNGLCLNSFPDASMKRFDSVYIPPKEIISAFENFAALYSEYHIAFEEMYYDLARLLDRPLKKGPNTSEQNNVIKNFESILNGNIVLSDKKFYLNAKDMGNFEMGLVSEGYRKLSTIMYLILNGSLGKNSILFWDEPETNMNPKIIGPTINAIIELAKMGVQVFVTTHDYFVQQGFNLAASYPQTNRNNLDISFISLYHQDNLIRHERAETLHELANNPVMQEFDDLYSREQEILNGNV